MRKGPLNPKYIRVEVRIGLITKKAFRTGQIVGIGDSTQVVGLNKTIETVIFEETVEDLEDKIIEEDIEMIDIMIIIEAGTGQEKRSFTRNYSSDRDRSSSNSRSRSGSRASTNRDRIRCYNCRSMTILQEIVLIVEKRETWKDHSKC